MHDKKNNITIKITVFMPDVYLFIAPPNYFDTHEQMIELVKLSEKTGAAEDHNNYLSLSTITRLDRSCSIQLYQHRIDKLQMIYSYINAGLRSLI